MIEISFEIHRKLFGILLLIIKLDPFHEKNERGKYLIQYEMIILVRIQLIFKINFGETALNKLYEDGNKPVFTWLMYFNYF